jgi:hypothetical protein
MIIYNNKIFSEDPLFKFHFEDFNISDNINLYLGNSDTNLLISDKNKFNILLELEQPNRFLHPNSHGTTFICEDFFDKILTINPEFVKNRNEQLGKNLYEHVFFPFSSRYVPISFEKTNDVIYTGNKNYFNICGNIGNHSLIWVGENGHKKNITYEEKLHLTRSSKIALSHSIVDFKDVVNFMDEQKNTVSNIDGIFEQHKARTIEAAFSKSIIVHVDTGQKLIEEFFKEGEDFLYYKDGLIDEILNNYEDYKFISENAFNKAVNNYTTEHFYKKYIKPLL